MILTPGLVERIKAHALAEYPREACGLIAGGQYLPCRNVAERPEQHFVIASEDYLRAEALGPLEAVVHSHRPDQLASPSAADMAAQAASGLPWVIVVCNGEVCPDIFAFGDQLPIQPLVGRTFRHGVSDCYSIVRDYYRLKLDITLPDFPRDDGWWNRGETLYADGFEAAGFTCYARGDEGRRWVKLHDVLLIQYLPGVKTPHHAAVYVGKGLMLHHHADTARKSRVSRHEPAAGWSALVTHWLRHKSLA
jgi:proteasome lid subunit RPN8/RPN11